MTLSSLIGALARRETATPPRPASTPTSSPDLMAVLHGSGLRFVPPKGEQSLGGLREVRERIADILPGVTFDEEGRGAFTRTGYSVAFETGCSERVDLVRVEITGGVAALPPLQRLALKTGWRLQSADHADV